MKQILSFSSVILLLTIFLFACNQKSETVTTAKVKAVSLPSWNEGATKSAIINYVNEVTNPESENFIAISDRITSFENDGNLWSEQPAYFQLFSKFGIFTYNKAQNLY